MDQCGHRCGAAQKQTLIAAMASKLLVSLVSILVFQFAYLSLSPVTVYAFLSACIWLWLTICLSGSCFVLKHRDLCVLVDTCVSVWTCLLKVFACCLLIVPFLLPHFLTLIISLLKGASLSLIDCLSLSISLMEHLPTHTSPHSCPLLTHLSIHTCLSANVCVFVSASFHRECRDSGPCKHTCQTSRQPSSLCLCVCLRGASCQEKPADEKEDISSATSATMSLLLRC